MGQLIESILKSNCNLSKEDSVTVFGQILAHRGEWQVYDSAAHPECEELCLRFINKHSYLQTKVLGLYRSVQPGFVYQITEDDGTIYSKGLIWENGYIFVILHEGEYILYLMMDKKSQRVFGYPGE